MANSFIAAARAAMAAWSRKPGRGDPVDPTLVRWPHAIAAVTVIVLLAAVVLIVQSRTLVLQELPAFAELLLLSLALLAPPFVVLIAAALVGRQRAKLPLLVMSTAINLLVVQVTATILSFLGTATSLALVGVTAFFVGKAARSILDYSTGIAILVGLITAAGVFAASFVVLMLPAAHAMLPTS